MTISAQFMVFGAVGMVLFLIGMHYREDRHDDSMHEKPAGHDFAGHDEEQHESHGHAAYVALK